MLLLTFDEYDKLMDEAMEVEIPENYQFPQISTIGNLADADKLKEILIAYVNTTDKVYKKDLDAYLREYVYLSDEKEQEQEICESEKSEKLNITEKQMTEIAEYVNAMDFQCSDWYPGTRDKQKLSDIGSSIKDIAFLLWLLNTPMQLSEDEQSMRIYINGLLRDRISLTK